MTPDWSPSGIARWIWSLLTYDPAEPLFFTGAAFLPFLMLFFAVYTRLGRSARSRILIILVFSLWFYYKSSGIFVLAILASGAFNYVTAMTLSRSKSGMTRSMLFIAGISVNIALLVLLKYTPWFALITGLFAGGVPDLAALAFPAGLSFYTFANLSYLIDVKRGSAAAATSLTRYLACITFFPVVQMGPIERPKDLLPQFTGHARLSREDVAGGFYLVVSGAIKKMVIGDFINLHLVAQVFGAPERYTGMENLAAAIGYSLVIYCDFSGYTDMARGIARWMGFRIRLNFNFPYRSDTIGDFWRRWHISLSEWLRDYLFLPLAYRLSGMIRRDYLLPYRLFRTETAVFSATALVTFAACGLWHGIGWNFLIWGLMHGAALSVQKQYSRMTRGMKRRMGPAGRRLNKIIATLLTFAFVTCAWIFFRMPGPEESLAVLARIFTDFYPRGFLPFIAAYYPVLMMMTAGFALHFLPAEFYVRIREILVPLGWPWKAVLAAAALILIVYFRDLGSAMPIYIRF